jgi:hypothetical protein
MDIFRRLRNFSGKQSPLEALNLLFKLLISIEEDYTQIDAQKWNILDIPVSVGIFDSYVEQIKRGIKSIQPDLDLILRHISGTLFQEADKEVLYFDLQRDLFGGTSNKLITKKNNYSSVHYTPQYLARSIVENCLKQIDLTARKSLKIFDAACGSSEFLIETLKQLKNIGYTGKVKVIGWDNSESAIATSNFLLKYEQRTQWNGTLEYEIKKVNDSLTEQWGKDYDLIVMNPPYVSWELLEKENRDAISDALGNTLKNGKPNQASAFFYKGVKSLKQGGVIGCVLPTSILTSDAYFKLRNEIQEEISLNLIAKLGNFVFESALTDVCFLVGKKETSNFPPQLLWNKNEKGAVQSSLQDLRKVEVNNLSGVEAKIYSIYTPSKFPVVSDSWKVISLQEEKFLKNIEISVTNGILARVSEIFSVKQGIRTGNNNIFKISKNEYDNIPQIEKIYFKAVIDNDAIKQGALNTNGYVWYPYDMETGNSLFVNEQNIQETLPYFYNNHLKNHKEELANRKKNIPSWWDLSDRAPRLLPVEKSIVSTEFGNSSSFSINESNENIVERGYMWKNKNKFFEDDYYFYLSCFSSSVFDLLLSIYSKPIMSGYYLGQIYTKNIPIPNVFLPDIRESIVYSKLVELGKDLKDGKSFVKPFIGDVLKNSFYPSF